MGDLIWLLLSVVALFVAVPIGDHIGKSLKKFDAAIEKRSSDKHDGHPEEHADR